MKNAQLTTLVLSMAIVLLVAACGEKAVPTPPTRTESASDTLKNDNAAIATRLAEQKAAVDSAFQQQQAVAERQQFAESLTALGKRWQTAIGEAAGSVRSNVEPIIKKFEALKAEVDALAVNECTGAARAALSAAMATAIDAYTQFSRETGGASDAVQQKVQQATTQFGEYEKLISACRR